MIQRMSAGRQVLVALAVAMLVIIGRAPALEGSCIEHVSYKSFDETSRHLAWGFGGYGLAVVAQLDYQHGLGKIDIAARRSRMFEVMRLAWAKTTLDHEAAAALGLPVRLYIYEREDRRIVVSDDRPSAMSGAYGKEGLTALGQQSDTALHELVHAATRRDLEHATRRVPVVIVGSATPTIALPRSATAGNAYGTRMLVKTAL